MYSFTSMVRFSETDETGRLSLFNLMNYLQDCCLFQSESLGAGPAHLKETHHLWLLSGWQIVIDRYPEMFEEITVGTIPYRFSGCIGWRNVFIADKEGKMIVKANSPWIYINTDTGKLEHPDEAEKAVYDLEDCIEMDYAPRKIVLPGEMDDCEPVPVQQRYIDSNHHVNNAQYAEIAREVLNIPMPVKEIRIEYKNQAKRGDIMYPQKGKMDGWNDVIFKDSAGHIFAVVAMRF